MKTQRLYSCLTLAALLSIWSCTSSKQTAQNAGEADDLYGVSGNASVYASNRQSDGYSGQQSSRSLQRYDRQQQRSLRNANPDYNDDQQYGVNGGTNTDEYYTELSARKLNRGLSPDPGWNDTGTNAYNSGFVNGYNAATTSAYSWNRWGFNNTGFYSGLGLGLGMGAFGGYGGYGYNSFGFGFGSPFYSPFYGSAFAYSPFYSPFGYGSFYDPFYSSYAFGGFGGYYSPFYSPYYGGGYYGGGYYNNAYVTGADPYRNRTYSRTLDRSSGRYSSAFDNSARTYNPNGGRTSAGNGSTSTSRSDGYYARPSGGSNRGSYYYDNSSSSNGRTSSNATVPSYNSNSGNSNSEYYARPRESNRGSYTPSNSGSSYSNSGSGRSSYQPSYQQPSYQSQSSRGSYSQPQQSYQQPTQSYSQPSRSFSTPSYSAPSGGGGFSSGGGGGHSGGGGRGPR